MSQQVKTLMLPVAMIMGFIFSGFFARLNPVTPCLIFMMLAITFCRIAPSDMKFSPMHIWLLGIQIVGGMAVYLGLSYWDETAAQGIAMCVFAPTAVSTVVIGGMLGANVAVIASFTFLSNIGLAVTAPILFSFVGQQVEMPFWESFTVVISRVIPILVLPMAAAFILRKLTPRIHRAVAARQEISFYLWAFSLMIVSGRTAEFLYAQDASNYNIEIIIAAGGLAACITQFLTGRLVGGRWGDRPAGGQSLGQKNTVLAIWMSQVYLNPIASIGPASYVLWQNIVNSYQLWRSARERNMRRQNNGA